MGAGVREPTGLVYYAKEVLEPSAHPKGERVSKTPE